MDGKDIEKKEEELNKLAQMVLVNYYEVFAKVQSFPMLCRYHQYTIEKL